MAHPDASHVGREGVDALSLDVEAQHEKHDHMLSDNETSLMQNCLHALREHMPGLAMRSVQLTMMGEVAHALASIGQNPRTMDASLCIAVTEAGTGIGKAVGYLLSAMALEKPVGADWSCPLRPSH